jgi:hypothetical protein
LALEQSLNQHSSEQNAQHGENEVKRGVVRKVHPVLEVVLDEVHQIFEQNGRKPTYQSCKHAQSKKKIAFTHIADSPFQKLKTQSVKGMKNISMLHALNLRT